MEAAMTTTNTATAPALQPAARANRSHRRTPAQDPGPQLAAVASNPEVDPCDLACDAMPGYVCGDLTQPDTSWLLTHTAHCGYCNRMLKGYERLDDVLDDLNEVAAEAPPLASVLQVPHAAFGRVDSPVGPLWIAVTDKGVAEISFASRQPEKEFRRNLEDRGLLPVPDAGAVARIADQLREYFEGRRDRFEVPLDFSGVSPFTRAVLDATAAIQFGQVRTYRQIAQQVGKPGATRAVGNALHRNPIPLIIPCHRIVRSDASLGGYAGGPEIKQKLLSHEGVSLV